METTVNYLYPTQYEQQLIKIPQVYPHPHQKVHLQFLLCHPGPPLRHLSQDFSVSSTEVFSKITEQRFAV